MVSVLERLPATDFMPERRAWKVRDDALSVTVALSVAKGTYRQCIYAGGLLRGKRKRRNGAGMGGRRRNVAIFLPRAPLPQLGHVGLTIRRATDSRP